METSGISDELFQSEMDQLREVFLNEAVTYEARVEAFSNMRRLMGNSFPDIVYFLASMCDIQSEFVCFLMDLLCVSVTEDYMLLIPIENKAIPNIENTLYNYVNENDIIRSVLIRSSIEQLEFFIQNFKMKFIEMGDRMHTESPKILSILIETRLLLARFIVWVHRGRSSDISMWNENGPSTSAADDSNGHELRKPFLQKVKRHFDNSLISFHDGVADVLKLIYETGDVRF